MHEEVVVLNNGKYTFTKNGFELKCKRFGEEWMDFTNVKGCNAINALFNEMVELKDRVEHLECQAMGEYL